MAMPATRRSLSVVAPILLALTLGACSALRFSIRGTPTEVVDRSTLPACGYETTSQTDGFNDDGRRCFWDAYVHGQPAEFISTRPSVEGDPITTIYRMLGSGHVEIFVDSTKDRYGGGWSKLTCATLDPVPGRTIGPDLAINDSCVASDIH